MSSLRASLDMRVCDAYARASESGNIHLIDMSVLFNLHWHLSSTGAS